MTEQITTTAIAPLPTEIAVGTGFEPSLDDHKKAVAIHVVSPGEMTQCSFWLGLFQEGNLSASDLLSNPSIDRLFQDAATSGLAESGPVMLSDSSATPAKFIYLLPKPVDNETADSSWINNLVTTVKSWSPQKAGIYLAPELLNNEVHQKLLGFMMKKLIVATKTTDYFLIPGAQGINQIVNTSIKIKHDLEAEKILVYVFH